MTSRLELPTPLQMALDYISDFKSTRQISLYTFFETFGWLRPTAKEIVVGSFSCFSTFSSHSSRGLEPASVLTSATCPGFSDHHLILDSMFSPYLSGPPKCLIFK